MRMVRWCIQLTRLTLVCEVIRYCLVQVRQNHKKKRLFGLAARNRLALSLPLSFSSSSYFLSFSIQKWKLFFFSPFRTVLSAIHMQVTDRPPPDAPSLTQAIIVQMVYLLLGLLWKAIFSSSSVLSIHMSYCLVVVDHCCWWKLTWVNVATCTGVLYVLIQ